MNANSIEPFWGNITLKRCPICGTMSELVDVARQIFICYIHEQWEANNEDAV